MAISDRITSIEQHLQEDYSVLELAGADLTNVNKNILNLKSTWQERLLYFMNNGTDVAYNNWDKVTGEGEQISLNNTLEAKMKINLKGNTSQEGTPTPETPQDIHVVSGDNSINVCGKNLFNKNAVTNGYYLNINGGLDANSNYCVSDFIPVIEGEQYYIPVRGTTRTKYYLKDKTAYSNTWDVSDVAQVITIPNNVYFIRITVAIAGSTQIDINTFQFEKGNQATTYEPYQSNSYDIDLKSKNLWSLNGMLFTSWGVGDTNLLALLNSLDEGTYTLTLKARVKTLTTTQTTYRWGIYASGSGFSLEGRNNLTQTLKVEDLISHTVSITINSTNKGNFTSAYTYTISSTSGSVSGIVELEETQLEKGNTATDYAPYYDYGELCKIGDYQDRIFKSTGKNLFNKDSQDILENVRIGADGGNNADNGYFISEFIEVQPNTKYTKNTTADAYHRFAFYTDKSTTSFISKSEDNTITTPSNAKYLRICGLITEKNTIMLNEGTTSLPYEPYGIGWYVKKEIGKIVLDGSENISGEITSVSGYYRYFIDVNNIKPTSSATEMPNIYCNYYKAQVMGTAGSWGAKQGISIENSTTRRRICINDNTYYTQDTTAYKTWLSTHNTIVYYVLATPTYTEITDSTLISQLNALAKSYLGQTNISQSNDDLPFILTASALEVMQ